MRAVVQRVRRAQVRADGIGIAAIGSGMLVLVGIARGDDRAAAERLAGKIARLRIFDDADGRMNLDLRAANGACLVVSQFTLLADTRRGHRPSFLAAAPPESAVPLYETFLEKLKAEGIPVAVGRFGARMEVELVNDGPVTLVLDEPFASGPPLA